MSIKAYNEMVSLVLSDDDRQMFEWAVGCMLTGGPRRVVALYGHARTGKTTLTTIARKVVLTDFVGNYAPRVAFLSDNRLPDTLLDHDVFVMMEVNTKSVIPDGVIFIETIGGNIPVNKYHILMREIGTESADIARHCIARYQELGEDYPDTVQENNR